MHCVAVSSTVAFGLTLAITIGHCAESGVEHPNVVLVVTDDQGYGDLSCHGNPILNTPNLDQLHAESVRFTDFHVDPTCSPTRGSAATDSLLTKRQLLSPIRCRRWPRLSGLQGKK